jgi:hypothetical protein
MRLGREGMTSTMLNHDGAAIQAVFVSTVMS